MQTIGPAVVTRRRITLRSRQLAGLVFATPAIIYLAVFFVYPFCYSAYLSFCEWDLVSELRFVGLSNYVRMASDTLLHSSVLRTLYYVFGAGVPIWVLSLFYSLWFNNRFRGKGFYIVVFLMAALMGLVPSLMAWSVLLHQNYGLFNRIFFYSWGFKTPLNWLNTPLLAMPGIIITSLSTGIPFYSIYLIGAVASVPEEYHEVARIEGANWMERLWYVVLPTIKPVFLFVIVVSIVTGFQYMGPMYILTRGGPVDATMVISLHMWLNAFKYNRFGYSAAMTVLLLAVLAPMTYFSLRLGEDER